MGPAVRMQNGGRDLYLGIYWWNNGSPELMLFLRQSGSWTQLGGYNSGPLAAGTQLRLIAVGNTISFQVNGVQRIAVTDDTLTGGAPGIMAHDNATADNWSGSNTGFQVSYASTDSQGIKSYDVLSASNGYGPQTLRVLSPANPAAGVAHNFLIVLPVEAGLGTTSGDGLATLAASWDFPADMSAYDQYGSAGSYGTDANFQQDYRLTQSFVDARKGPFTSSNRIWIGSYWNFQGDVSDYDALLTAEGIQHTTEPPQAMPHRWDSGWVPLAMAALYQDSINLH